MFLLYVVTYSIKITSEDQILGNTNLKKKKHKLNKFKCIQKYIY
jgi:hypothetical protein